MKDWSAAITDESDRGLRLVGDRHLFQLGEKLLLVTVERQTILVDDQIAGFVEALYDREKNRSEARIWLYPAYRSMIGPIRNWIERSMGEHLILDIHLGGTDVVRFEEDAANAETLESVWSVGIRSDRSMGYEVFLTDRLTGFLYPLHASRSRRKAFEMKRQIEGDLFVLSESAFAEKWGIQRIYAWNRQ